MNVDEVFNKLLEADEQADRSLLLDDLRDHVVGVQGSLDKLTEEATLLNETNEKLKQRNGELFVRLDDRGLTQEKKQEKEEKLKMDNMSVEEKVQTTMFE